MGTPPSGVPRAQPRATVDDLSPPLGAADRAREALARATDIAVETYRESPPAVLGAAAVLLALVAGLVSWRRKR